MSSLESLDRWERVSSSFLHRSTGHFGTRDDKELSLACRRRHCLPYLGHGSKPSIVEAEGCWTRYALTERMEPLARERFAVVGGGLFAA